MKPLGYGDPLRIGPYRLIAVLGEGGMGKVYLGRDSAARTAAVKVLRRELAHDAHMAQRFVREAQSAQSVRSRGVARVLTVQTEGGRPFIATEFLAGPTLDDAVHRYGPLHEPHVRALGAALARTLGDVHAAGLVHRDLKPSNIVLTSSGPRIIDFGIARPEHGLTLTTTGQTPVTPGYGAPEQVLGQRTGPPGDMFALGAVLVYASTGAHAYRGGHVAAVQYEVVHGSPRLEGVPAALRPLVEPCLAKDPALRPLPAQVASAMAPPRGSVALWKRGSVAAEIGRSEERVRQLATFPNAPGAETKTGAGGSGPSRRRLLAGLAAGGTVLAAGGAGAWWLLADGKPPRAHPWDADPLSEDDYRRGRAPAPLWGPRRTPETGRVTLHTVRDLVVLDTQQPDLIAYSVTTGTHRWTAKGVGNGAFHAPRLGLFLATGLDRLYGISAGSGKRLWKKYTDIITPLAADGSVYFYHEISGDHRVRGKVVALSVTRHAATELWRKPMPFDSEADDVEAVAAGGRLVLTAGSYGAVALDVSDGSRAWTAPRKWGAARTPFVAGDTVYLGGETLRAVRLDDGGHGWSRPASTNLGLSVQAADGDRLFLLDNSQLRCHSAKDGGRTWARELSGPAYGKPAVSGDTVWVSTEQRAEGIRAFRKDSGKELWTRHEAGRDGQGSGGWALAGAGNRVFAVRDRRLTAFPVV